jgi:hypothetical protein
VKNRVQKRESEDTLGEEQGRIIRSRVNSDGRLPSMMNFEEQGFELLSPTS